MDITPTHHSYQQIDHNHLPPDDEVDTQFVERAAALLTPQHNFDSSLPNYRETELFQDHMAAVSETGKNTIISDPKDTYPCYLKVLHISAAIMVIASIALFSTGGLLIGVTNPLIHRICFYTGAGLIGSVIIVPVVYKIAQYAYNKLKNLEFKKTIPVQCTTYFAKNASSLVKESDSDTDD